jgi:hypothetical protein
MTSFFLPIKLPINPLSKTATAKTKVPKKSAKIVSFTGKSTSVAGIIRKIPIINMNVEDTYNRKGRSDDNLDHDKSAFFIEIIGDLVALKEIKAVNINAMRIKQFAYRDSIGAKALKSKPITRNVAPLTDERFLSSVSEAKYPKRTGTPYPKNTPINADIAKSRIVELKNK